MSLTIYSIDVCFWSGYLAGQCRRPITCLEGMHNRCNHNYMLTALAILDRLPFLQPSNGYDKSHHHTILHTPLPRIHTILPSVLGRHHHRMLEHYRFYVPQHFPVHANTLELESLQRKRRGFSVYGFEQTAMVDQYYEYYF